MPQARRKTPFSGKAKKQQLQTKKNKTLLLSTSPGSSGQDVIAVNYQPQRGGGRGDRNKYALKFYRESDAELQALKEDALKALNPVSEEQLEVDPRAYFPKEVSFPKRPPWNHNMTPAQLDAQEHRYFNEYTTALERSPLWKEMSYSELNLETWRQLWRVLEMCDVLLLVVDVRYCGCMFPPSLYEHITSLNKSMILVLNKIDLVPAAAVAAWKQHLTDRYPGLKVVYFTSCPGYNLRGGTSDKAGLQIRRRKGRQRMCAEGASKILEACAELVAGAVDLGPWEKKIREETGEYDDDEEPKRQAETIIQKPDTTYYEHEKFKNGVLTIGCVGQPNVGKSSLLNALMGRKVVSVSKTPGHTKHFQTIYLTPQVRLCDCPGLVFPSTVPRPVQVLMGSYPIAQLRQPYTTISVRLCDCPGLVFPSTVPRPVQVLMGSYPIAQLRQPYTTIRYLAERLDLPRLLRMEHPEKDDEWSPRDICDGWAKKRGYLTAKAARLDTYRAANSLLRMALDGKICLWLRPPGYSKEKEKWETCDEIKYIRWVQSLTEDAPETVSDIDVSDDDRGPVESEPTDDDDDDDDSSDDGAHVTVMANKFAALGGDE